MRRETIRLVCILILTAYVLVTAVHEGCSYRQKPLPTKFYGTTH